MATRATTDNFLPAARGKSHYQSRPVLYTPREYPKPLISDFLPTKIREPKPIRTQRKRSIYVLPLVVLLVVVGSAASFKLIPTQKGQASMLAATVPTKPELLPQQAVGLPVRLKIPKIGVDAAIGPMGLTASGDLDIPKNPTDTGWYDQGPRPGEKGSAVIDGHFGYRDDIPAVFDNLHRLQKGDLLQVEDENGLIATFMVRELREFDPNEATEEVFKSDDGKAHLNLITCHGTWNNAQKSYSNRLVVFADQKD